MIARRLALLGVFGALHISLFWWGDILLHYAILGLSLVVTRRWPARRLVLFALQAPIAVLYARRFRFGPAEWLWRAGTYGRRPT